MGRTISGFTYQQSGQTGLGVSTDVIKNSATVKNEKHPIIILNDSNLKK